MSICQLVKIEGNVIASQTLGNITFKEKSEQLGEFLSNYVASPKIKYIALDCSKSEHMDSAGIGELVKAHISCARTNKEIVYIIPNSKTLDYLKLAGLDKVLNIYSNFETLAKDNKNYVNLAKLK